MIAGKKTDEGIIFPTQEQQVQELFHKTPGGQPFDVGFKMIGYHFKLLIQYRQIIVDKGPARRIDVENSCTFSAHIIDAPFS